LKPKLKKTALISFGLVFAFLAFKEPRYLATATFHESSKGEEQSSNLRSLFLSAAGMDKESVATSVMLSQRVGRSVVEKLGLQAKVKEKNFLLQAFSNLWGNLLSEIGIRQADHDGFIFHDLFYGNEETLNLYLRFKNAQEFEVLDEKKQLACEGKIGGRIKGEKYTFVLAKTPAKVKQNKLMSLKILPWAKVVKSHLKRLEIRSSKKEKNFLKLFYSHPNRHLASTFLNEVMAAYQSYLKRENEELAKAQLTYLAKRQDELAEKLDALLDEQAAYLEKNLGEEGFVGLQQEMEILAIPKQSYTSKLFDLEVEEKRLEEKKRFFAKNDEDEWSEEEDKKLPKKQNKTALGANEKKFETQLTALSQEESKIEAASSRELPKRSEEHEKIDLTTAQTLYSGYQTKRDEHHQKIAKLLELRKKIQASEFEISSLGGYFDEPVGQEIVQKAAALALKLNDQKNHSVKELERLKEQLAGEKAFLLQHIEQTLDLERSQASLLEEKIGSVQAVYLSLIRKEKSLIEKKLKELTGKMQNLPEKWKMENQLQIQKELSMGIMEGISKASESKNLHHNLFYVGSKPVDRAVAPLRAEHPFLLLFSFGGALLSGSLFFLGALGKKILYGFPVTTHSLKESGLDVRGTFSSFCHAPLSEMGDQDLQTLRGLLNFIMREQKEKGSIVVALIGDKMTNYSSNLAELLAMQHKPTLLIDLSFEQTLNPDDKEGLWHYLEGKSTAPALHRKKGYDFLAAGKESRHAPELLARPAFYKLLQELRSRYEIILLNTCTRANLSDSHLFFNLAQALVITTDEEKLEELQPFVKWNREQGERAVVFACKST
jgi:hypothetical protein